MRSRGGAADQDGRGLFVTPLFTAAYVVSAFAGRLTIVDGQSLSLVWPAAGVAVVWFGVRHGRRRWPDALALLGSSVVVNLLTGSSTPLAIAFAAANLVQVAVVLGLLGRWSPHLKGVGGARRLSRVEDLWHIAAAALSATVAGAGVGTTALALATGHWSALGTSVWVARNAVSILLIGGLALRLPLEAAAQRRTAASVLRALGRVRRLEYAALVVGSPAAYTLLFLQGQHVEIVIPLLVLSVWAGSRFSPTFVAVHDLAMGVLAVAFTLHGDGPFAAIEDPLVRAFFAQLFVAVVAVTGLSLALAGEERRQLLEELRERSAASAAQARLLTSIVETMAEGLAVYDSAGRVSLQNGRSVELTGGVADRAEDIAGDEGYGLHRPDGSMLPIDEVPVRRALQGGQVRGAKVLLRTPRLAVDRMLSISATPLPQDVGGGAVVLLRDITDEERDRQALHESERKHEDAFDSSLVGNLHASVDGTVLRVNQAAARMLGYTPDELTGTHWPDNTHPDDLDSAARGLARVVLGELPGLSGEIRYMHRDGGVVHAQVSAVLVRDPAGAPSHFATQLVEVTDRVHAERELRRQRDLYLRLLEALSDLGEGVAVQSEGRLTYANEACARLTGRTVQELLSLPTPLLLAPDSELDMWVQRQRHRAAGRPTAPVVTGLRRPDGSTVRVEMATLLLAETGTTVTVVRDLTEQVLAAQALTDSFATLQTVNADLRDANQLKDDVVAMLSHDLRQPLTSTIGFCDLLLDEWDNLCEGDKRQLLGRVRRAGNWANDLLEDILTMAQLEQGAPNPVPHRVHLPHVFADLVDRLGIDSVAVDLDGVESLDAWVDRGHLDQILGNLLGNAFKYGRPPVTVRARLRGTSVLVDVIDSGDGVPEEFVPQLFERFTRASSGTALVAKGTGLGLYLARSLARANGAELTYSSSAGGGARFILTLAAGATEATAA